MFKCDDTRRLMKGVFEIALQRAGGQVSSTCHDFLLTS